MNDSKKTRADSNDHAAGHASNASPGNAWKHTPRAAPELTKFIGAREIKAAVGCSTATAYRLLALAGAGVPALGGVRIRRIPVDAWERFAARQWPTQPGPRRVPALPLPGPRVPK